MRLIQHLALTLLVTCLLTGTVARPRDIKPTPRQCVRMVSSFYGPGFDGRSTASGALFDREALTAAHRTLPFGTRLRLTNPKTNKSVTVEVTDRGPYNEFAGIRYFTNTRDLDVSEGVARRLGFEREGVTTLTVELLPPFIPQTLPR